MNGQADIRPAQNLPQNTGKRVVPVNKSFVTAQKVKINVVNKSPSALNKLKKGNY